MQWCGLKSQHSKNYGLAISLAVSKLSNHNNNSKVDDYFAFCCDQCYRFNQGLCLYINWAIVNIAINNYKSEGPLYRATLGSKL